MAPLYYREMGSGPPLIILHGLLGSGDNWQRIAKALAADYRVILPDARNHGRSPHYDSITYVDMAEDLKKLCQDLDINSAIIIGHSMGGKTAMTFSWLYPQMVHRLIIVDITPAAYSENDFATIFQAMNSFDPATKSSRQEIEERVGEYIKNPLIRGFILKNLARRDSGGFRWKVNLPVIYRDLGDISGALAAGEYSGPALFIAGEESNYISSDTRRSIMEAFPEAEVVSINGAGHWVHYEAPQKFLEIVQRYLSQGAPK